MPIVPSEQAANQDASKLSLFTAGVVLVLLGTTAVFPVQLDTTRSRLIFGGRQRPGHDPCGQGFCFRPASQSFDGLTHCRITIGEWTYGLVYASR
jgi:hypothetical protein